MQNLKKKFLLNTSFDELCLSSNFKKKLNKINKKLKNKNYFFIKKATLFDSFYLLNLLQISNKNKNFFKQVRFLKNKLSLKTYFLKNNKKKISFKINSIAVKDFFACKLKILIKNNNLKFFDFNFFFFKIIFKLTNINYNINFFNYFLKDWLALSTSLNFKTVNSTNFMSSFNFHEEYFFFRWFDKKKKASLVYSGVSTLFKINSYSINFLDFFNEASSLKINEFNLNSFSLIFEDYYFEILKKIKFSEHEISLFKSKKIKFLKKNKKKLNFIKVRFVTLKKVLTFKKSKFFKLRKIPQKIFFSNKWTLNMYPKFITKNLLLSSNNEKIIYQNLYKTLSSWNNQELNYNYNKQLGKNKDFYFKKGYVSKFNSFFIKKGKKLTSFNRVMSSFSIFLNDSLDFLISEEYLKSSITIFFEFLNDSTSNININKILCWMADISGFIYFFKTKALPKFLKKKLKKKYTTEPFFINSSLRYRYTLKYFYFFIENSDFSKLESRILSNVCSLAYENEESSFFDLRNKALKKAVLRAFKKKK